MPVSRRINRNFWVSTAFVLSIQAASLGWVASAWAITENQPLHSSGDKEFWDRKRNRVELFGHAVVRQPGENLTADYALLDLNTRTVDARGNCVYVAQDSIIMAEEMHFNLDTHTGSVIAGRVSNGQFTLAGERINKLGEGRFQTHWGEYSTCHDCPQSWTIQAEDVDMEFDGYAYMTNVTIKVKDTPTAWLPFMIIPVKNQRQTGFLLPHVGLSERNGWMFVLPFFWAINRSSDMTLGLGDYTLRGKRLEWEGRYALTPFSSGKANYNLIFNDKEAQRQPELNLPRNRWGFSSEVKHVFPLGLVGRMRLRDTSDNLYPFFVGDGLLPASEAFLTSETNISHSSSALTAWLGVKRSRNLLYAPKTSSGTDSAAFDPRTVQIFPSVGGIARDRFLFDSPVAAGFNFSATNFTRTADFFDYDSHGTSPPPRTTADFQPGTDPIRKATRVSMTPSLYTTLRPFDVLSVVPSLQYRHQFYDFHADNRVGPLNSGYVLLQADFTTQFEKIYETKNPDYPKIKHLVRPQITYSIIPYELRFTSPGDHPFRRQMEFARVNGFSGYNFDNNDVVPLESDLTTLNYYVPLGHTISYGFKTQVIQRNGSVKTDSPSYSTPLEMTAGQSLNLREFNRGEGDRRPLSRFYSTLKMGLGKFSSDNEYYYYPYIKGPRGQIITTQKYSFISETRQKILVFDRSLSLTYTYDRHPCDPDDAGFGGCGTSVVSAGFNFSLNDYILPQLSAGYSFIQHSYLNYGLNLIFQSPSRCWKFALLISKTPETKGVTWLPDLTLNLTGQGYYGVTQLANDTVLNPPPR